MDILGQKRKYLIEIILKSLHYFMPHRVLRSIGKLMSQFTFPLIYIIIFLHTSFERFDSFNFHSITHLSNAFIPFSRRFGNTGNKITTKFNF